jgi:hypothetical protein
MKYLLLSIFILSWSRSVLPQKADFYQIPPTKFEILNGSNLPKKRTALNNLTARVAAGEYEPFSILIDPKTKLTGVKVVWTDFKGPKKLPKRILDASLVKVWWQAAVNTTINENGDTLVQELLVKNDNLIRVNYSKRGNELLIMESGKQRYADISSIPPKLPAYFEILDSKELLPFNMNDGRKKQLWFTLHVPDKTPKGKYKTQITISSDQGELKKFELEFTVLPFALEKPVLDYGIYYTAAVVAKPLEPKYLFGGLLKSEKQYEIELRDMLEHGIRYPHNSNNPYSQDLAMKIRNKVGLPDDKIFLHAVGVNFSGCALGKSGYADLSKTVGDYINAMESLGYKKDRLYFYGFDEANTSRYGLKKGELTTLEKAVPLYKRIKETYGIKIFQAISNYGDNFKTASNYLDLPILYGQINSGNSWYTAEKISREIKMWQSKGKKVYAYSNPQAACENPEVYRRNHGLLAWKQGWNGIMDWKYQSTQGHTWNDWDNQYRDPNFTYPITNGVIPTIQWEGVREAVDDVRYLSTLLNRRDRLKKKNIADKSLDDFINKLDPHEDLDILRGKIIDKILEIDKKYFK